MKDIHIIKKKIGTKTLKLSISSINFRFFSKILNKYKNNEFVEQLLSQKIPLVFVTNNDNERILKSVSEILDILKKRREEEQTQENITNNNEDNSQKITNLDQSTTSYGNLNVNNDYYSPSLTYNYGPNNNKIVENLESIVTNIKKNFKIDKIEEDNENSKDISSKHKPSSEKELKHIDKKLKDLSPQNIKLKGEFAQKKDTKGPDSSIGQETKSEEKVKSQPTKDEIHKESETTLKIEQIK